MQVSLKISVNCCAEIRSEHSHSFQNYNISLIRIKKHTQTKEKKLFLFKNFIFNFSIIKHKGHSQMHT